MRTSLKINSLLFLLIPTMAAASTPADLADGVGVGDGARLTMLLEATIFNVDVANVEALLGPQDAAAVAAIAERSRIDDEARAQITEILLGAESCVITMRFLRDASWDRFLDGTRKNLERAVEADILTEDEFDELWQVFVADFAQMQERGVRKGDAVYYRVDPDRVRTVYFDGDENVLVSVDRGGDARVRGTLGAYFGPRSEFSRELIESLEQG